MKNRNNLFILIKRIILVLIAIFVVKTDSLFARAGYVARPDLNTISGTKSICAGYTF